MRCMHPTDPCMLRTACTEVGCQDAIHRQPLRMQTVPQTTRKRRSAVERERFVTPDGTILTVAHFHARTEEKAICLIPPLIGGSFILYGRQFATLMKQGIRVVSFNYRGHDRSGG